MQFFIIFLLFNFCPCRSFRIPSKNLPAFIRRGAGGDGNMENLSPSSSFSSSPSPSPSPSPSSSSSSSSCFRPSSRPQNSALLATDENSINNSSSQSSTVVNSHDNDASHEFETRLRYNLDRFAKILMDEKQLQQQQQRENNNDDNDNALLLCWLQENYGYDKTQQLHASNFHRLSAREQRIQLQDFLQWFRNEFPYFHDECENCHAKGATTMYQGNDVPTLQERTGQQQSSSYPCWIDTTELHYCTKCQHITRFPRYLSVMEIISGTPHRGRCSEYSLLLYRLLRVLNHSSRWIVDWANHLWVEIYMKLDVNDTDSDSNSNNGNDDDTEHKQGWIHLDPCEACVDNPLLYQEWGKKQTYIIAFEAPPPPMHKTLNVGIISKTKGEGNWSIVDVTQSYTTDGWETIQTRRQEMDGIAFEDVATSISNAQKDLRTFSLEKIIESYKGYY